MEVVKAGLDVTGASTLQKDKPIVLEALQYFKSRNDLMRNEVEVWTELLKRSQNVVAAAHRNPVTHAIIVAGWRVRGALGF